MNNNQMMQVFKNEQFGKVRGRLKDGEPWFVATDVCKALGVGNPSDAMRRLDDDEKGIDLIETLGGKQKLTVINEAGLYSVILSSRKPEAKQFKRWITHEVIPAIRKTGGYIPVELEMTDEEIMAKALFIMNNTIKERDRRIAQLSAENEVMAPKAEYCDMVLKAPNAVPISCIAKDYGMSARAFNQLLKDRGWQYKCGKMWLLTSKYQNKGYTKSETYVSEKTGNSYSLTKWTQTGRLGIYEDLKKDGILPLMER